MDHMTGKEVITIKVRNKKYEGGEDSRQISLVVLADSLHISLILTNWPITRNDGNTRKPRVVGELVEFQYW